MIDSNLTWNHHVDSVLRRLSPSCYALHYVKYTLTVDTLKLIYFANVLSIMSYGINPIGFYLVGYSFSIFSTLPK